MKFCVHLEGRVGTEEKVRTCWYIRFGFQKLSFKVRKALEDLAQIASWADLYLSMVPEGADK